MREQLPNVPPKTELRGIAGRERLPRRHTVGLVRLPPLLTGGESILVRLRYKAPRPGKPGTPTVTVPTGKSGALVVEWTAPSSNDPAVLGYQVYVTRGSQLRLKSVDASTTRLPVLLLEPDTAYDVRVRARTDLATGPWSDTARARTNPLQGTNRPQVTLDLNGVTKVKEGDGLPMRLKVTGMPNLHAGAFPERFEGEKQLSGVEFLLLDRIAKVYTYEDHPGGCSGGSFRSGALTIGEDGEVYHDSGYLVIPAGHVGIRAVVRRARHQMREHVGRRTMSESTPRSSCAWRSPTARTMSRPAALAPREGCRATPWTG